MRMRRAIYLLLALVALPLVLLALLEGALRVCGFGDSRAVFTPQTIAGTEYYTRNMAFLDSFFPFHREFGMVQFPVKKEPDTYRVFVLGSSAALGMPDPAFSLGRYLETMLTTRASGKHVEVNTVASAAINSHVVREVAKACARCEPDLFIVYMGNNEVLGPFGPASAFGVFDRRLPLIRFKIWLRTLRLSQLAAWLRQDVFGVKQPSLEWLGMQMFEHPVAATDPRLEFTYAHFRANLEDVISLGKGAGADVVVCTVGVNLKDLAPFLSLHGDTPAWRAHFDAGLQAQQKGDPQAARDAYAQALAIEPGHAETAWRYGHALLALNDTTGAKTALEQARDLDALRFRLDSRLNSIIRDVAQRHAEAGVILADVEQALNRASAGGIAGDDLFLEHVHFNDAGTYQAAAAVYDALRQRRMPGFLSQEEPPDQAACEKTLALTEFDRAQHRIEMLPMFYRPPFTEAQGAGVRITRFRREIFQLPVDSPAALGRALHETEQALKARPEDYWLRKKRGVLLGLSGDHEQAVRVLINLHADYPSHTVGTLVGLALTDSGKPAEALPYFQEALQSTPRDAVQYVNIGWACFQMGRLDEAVKAYRKALELDPKLDLAYNNLGLLLAAQEKPDDAEAFYRKALKADWRAAKPYGNLDDLYKERLKPEQRAAKWEALASELPQSPAPLYRAAMAHAEAGNIAAAEETYQNVLERDPLYVEAHIELGLLAENDGDLMAAAGHFQKALAISPHHYFANNNLGYCLFRQGKHEEAMPFLEKAIRLNPQEPLSVKNLDDLLLALGDMPARRKAWERLASEHPESVPIRQRLATAR